MRNYGIALKQQREATGISQLELSKKIGTSHQNISRWEKGEVLPNIHFCVKLADFYQITIDELIGRDFPKIETTEKTYINNSFNNFNNNGNINF